MQRPAVSQTEFIALIAVMFATVAFSVDAMLPALPDISRELSPDAPNRAQLIITSFMLGLGIGTFFTGPLSDALGRRPVVFGGGALFIFGAALAWVAPNLETVLAARVIQGLGAAGPRVVALAIVRDLYKGRDMARIVSLAFIVFTLFPAVAPALGAGIIAVAGWRAVFLVYVLFSVLTMTWLWLRQPETLPPEDRRPFRPALLFAALRELIGYPAVRTAILVQSLSFGVLFAMLSSVQSIYAQIFDRAESFPFWFGAVAVVAGSSGVINARLVQRYGMRAIVTTVMAVQVAASIIATAVFLSGLGGTAGFAVFVLWQVTVFFQIGMSVGNLNALAMEEVGHIAGLAASVLGSVATIAGVLIAIPVGLAFNGTAVPLSIGICAMSAAGVWLMRRLRQTEARAQSAQA